MRRDFHNSQAQFHCVWEMWAEVVGESGYFHTLIFTGFGLIAPLSNPRLLLFIATP
jgi:hypothetical protein